MSASTGIKASSVALLATLLIAAPTHAQYLDPDTCFSCRDSWEHFGASALLDVGAHTLFPRWKPWQRILLTGGLIGVAWEAGQADAGHALGAAGTPGFGFGFKDLAFDLAGAAAGEILWITARRLL